MHKYKLIFSLTSGERLEFTRILDEVNLEGDFARALVELPYCIFTRDNGSTVMINMSNVTHFTVLEEKE